MSMTVRLENILHVTVGRVGNCTQLKLYCI